jgi:hypothetical protein
MPTTEKGINQYKQRDAEAKAITELFQPYEWMLRNENATPATAIGPLLQTAALLRTGTPQQKSQAVAQMIQQFQIPLDQVAAYFGGEAPPQQDRSPLQSIGATSTAAYATHHAEPVLKRRNRMKTEHSL